MSYIGGFLMFAGLFGFAISLLSLVLAILGFGTGSALLALAKEIGSIPNIDQHQVFKAWVMLDRYSINSK